MHTAGAFLGAVSIFPALKLKVMFLQLLKLFFDDQTVFLFWCFEGVTGVQGVGGVSFHLQNNEKNMVFCETELVSDGGRVRKRHKHANYKNRIKEKPYGIVMLWQ